MPFGVELPENLGTESPSSAPETGTGAPSESGDRAPEIQQDLRGEEKSQATREQEVADLDKLQRFRFEGREWDPKSLKSAILAHADYTRKTQEVAEARKYADNFDADLAKVVENPNRLSELRQIYPAAYVQIAEKYLARLRESGNSGQVQPQQREVQNADHDLRRELQELKQWRDAQEAEKTELRVQQIQQTLDRQFENLAKKYEFADSLVVNQWALNASERGVKITEKVLETLFKQHNDQVQKRYEQIYRAKVDKQKQVGSKAKDMAGGGDAVGSAPKGPRTIKEATKQWLADLDGARS